MMEEEREGKGRRGGNGEARKRVKVDGEKRRELWNV